MLLRSAVLAAMFVAAVALGLHSADPLMRTFAGFIVLVAITLGTLMVREARRRR